MEKKSKNVILWLRSSKLIGTGFQISRLVKMDGFQTGDRGFSLIISERLDVHGSGFYTTNLIVCLLLFDLEHLYLTVSSLLS